MTGDLDALTEEVAQLVIEISGVPLGNNESDLRENGVDSMMLLELLAALEERFGISMDETIVEEFQSVNAIARLVKDSGRV